MSVGVNVAVSSIGSGGLLAGFHVVRGLAGPVVGFHGDCVEVFLGVSGRVGSLGEVLAQQAAAVSCYSRAGRMHELCIRLVGVGVSREVFG